MSIMAHCMDFYPSTKSLINIWFNTSKTRCIEISVMLYLHLHIYWSIRHNSQEMKTTELAIYRQMDFKNMPYTQGRILIFATTWANLESTMSSVVHELSTESDTSGSHLFVGLMKVELLKIDNRMVVTTD